MTTSTPTKSTRELVHHFTCTVVRIHGESVDLRIDDCEVSLAIIQRSDFSEADRKRLKPGVRVDWKIYYEDMEPGRRFKVGELRVRA